MDTHHLLVLDALRRPSAPHQPSDSRSRQAWSLQSSPVLSSQPLPGSILPPSPQLRTCTPAAGNHMLSHGRPGTCPFPLFPLFPLFGAARDPSPIDCRRAAGRPRSHFPDLSPTDPNDWCHCHCQCLCSRILFGSAEVITSSLCARSSLELPKPTMIKLGCEGDISCSRVFCPAQKLCALDPAEKYLIHAPMLCICGLIYLVP